MDTVKIGDGIQLLSGRSGKVLKQIGQSAGKIAYEI